MNEQTYIGEVMETPGEQIPEILDPVTGKADVLLCQYANMPMC